MVLYSLKAAMIFLHYQSVKLVEGVALLFPSASVFQLLTPCCFALTALICSVLAHCHHSCQHCFQTQADVWYWLLIGHLKAGHPYIDELPKDYITRGLDLNKRWCNRASAFLISSHTTASGLLALAESPSEFLVAIIPSLPLTPLNFITGAQN